jgi:choline-sulfatase
LNAASAEEPWVLFVGWVAPHFPLIAPPEFYNLYAPEDFDLPKCARQAEWPQHPWFEAFRRCFVTDNYFSDETRRVALASYYGLVSFLDDNVGRVLAALGNSGAAEDTLVIYTSDHGDNLGARGLWGKSTMYEESVGIPLIARGCHLGAGTAVRTPVSLVDLHPTILKVFGIPPDVDGRGEALQDVGGRPDDEERTVFAEYHAAGAPTGAFMLRKGHFKYVHYVDMPPQLFDLTRDPEELRDLAADVEYVDVRAQFEKELFKFCDPREVDRRAKADQGALIESYGGRAAVVGRGGFGATPPPGQKAAYLTSSASASDSSST